MILMAPKTPSNITPEEARKTIQAQKAQADTLRARVDRVVDSIMGLQKENGFGPKMEMIFRGTR